jgi:regulator of replication initiation timing
VIDNTTNPLHIMPHHFNDSCCYPIIQAKIQDLHQQIEELTQKVGSLQTENAALHSRTSILEKVLDMRNEQIQVMQESKEVSRPAGNG